MFIREQCLYQKSTVEPGGGCLRDEKTSAGGGIKDIRDRPAAGGELDPTAIGHFLPFLPFHRNDICPEDTQIYSRNAPRDCPPAIVQVSLPPVHISYLPCLLTCLCLSFETSLRIFALSNNGRPGGFAWQQRISVRGTGRVSPFSAPLLPRSPLNPNISSHVPPYS